MPTVLLRIFLLYKLIHSFLLYLVPKKLHSFLPSSWFTTTTTTTASLLPAPLPTRPSPEKRMDPSELKRVFQMFDRNGDGMVSKKELTDSLENLGIFISDKDLTDMISKIDINGDGFVDVDEFELLYRSILDERNEEEDMREAFNVFDENGDGFITVEELRSVLVSLGLKQGRTAEECKRMIMKVDADGDGRVDYKEFRQMMKCGGFGALAAVDH